MPISLLWNPELMISPDEWNRGDPIPHVGPEEIQDLLSDINLVRWQDDILIALEIPAQFIPLVILHGDVLTTV